MAKPQCLYELLEIPQTASPTEIKKAYRLQALQNHPDKNPTNQEAAEYIFKKIQNAYDVLSDPHERAWYDSHRDQILRGKHPSSGDAEATTAASATDIDLFSYFSSTVYKGWQGPTGFFAVFGAVFDALWKEELDAMENEQMRPAPPFGGHQSQWDTVGTFYREWECFLSRKSFSFADKWNLADASNRDVRRAMERENKRERQRLKKEFNTAVRELVSFVKKRDPRVMKRLEEAEGEKKRLEKELKVRSEIRKRERQTQLEEIRLARDEALEEDADALDEILATIALDERIERRREKKSRQRLDVLSEDEGSENEACDNGVDTAGEGSSNDGDYGEENGENDSGSEEEELENLYCIACRKPFRSMAQKVDHERSKKHKTAMAKMKGQVLAEEEEFLKSKKALNRCSNDSVDDSIKDLSEEDCLSEESMEKRPTKAMKRRKKKAQRAALDTRLDEKEIVETKDANIVEGIHSDVNGSEKERDEGHIEVVAEGDVKLSKKEKRRLREQKKKEAKEGSGKTSNSLSCNVCGMNFTSRNKLMRHVEKSGHALQGSSKKRR